MRKKRRQKVDDAFGTCRFCGFNRKLRESHIIPKMVYTWSKRTSSTGYLRHGMNMNKRQQDGPKPRFLCAKCERDFNAWETPFANEFFLPFHDERRTVIDYGPWMAKCCASIAWRILAWRSEQSYATTDVSPTVLTGIESALRTWKDFLNGKVTSVGEHELHLLLWDAISEIDGPAPPRHLHSYLLRAIDYDLIRDSKSAYAYCKMGRALLIGFVCDPGKEVWHGTRLEAEHGQTGAKELHLPDWLHHYIWSRAGKLDELGASVSPRQRERIAKDQRANPARILQSETFWAMLEDQRLRRSIVPPQGRNVR